jgi:hypothetical protein
MAKKTYERAGGVLLWLGFHTEEESLWCSTATQLKQRGKGRGSRGRLDAWLRMRRRGGGPAWHAFKQGGGLAGSGVTLVDAAAVGWCKQRTWRVGQLYGPGLMNSRLFNLFNIISNIIDLIRSKEVLPDFEKFQINMDLKLLK